MPEAYLPADGQQFGRETAPAPRGYTHDEIAKLLQDYCAECEAGRKERDALWSEHWDLYWQRVDMSDKAPWQSHVVLPEFPQFVERFAAALRKALLQAGEWYTIEAPPGQLQEFIPVVRSVVDYWLCRAGETENDSAQGFPTIFEEMLKYGALSKCEITVTARTLRTIVPRIEQREEPGLTMEEAPTTSYRVVHVKTQRTVVEIAAIDPQTVWRDPTGRGLYRRRRTEVDLHTLKEQATLKDDTGQPLWHAEEIAKLTPHSDADLERQRQDRSGETVSSAGALGRKPVVLDEFYGTIIDFQGNVVAENALAVLANGQYLVRGPEPNPFWHGKDWVVGGAVIRVPDTVYHKSYGESWAALARTFTEATNLILDATYTGSMNAFAGDPTVLEDPTQLKEGVHPNKFFILEEGRRAEEFIDHIDLGRLPAESLDVWRGIKDLLQEGAVLNDIMLGNIPAKSDVKATEVVQATESSAAFMESIAENIQLTCLDPVLNLTWQTALQHMDFAKEPELLLALGEQGVKLASLSPEERLLLIGGPYTFKAHGLTSVLQRAEKVRRLLAALQAISSNETLAAAFAQQFDMTKVPGKILQGFGIDPQELQGDQTSTPLPAPVQEGPPAAPPAGMPTPTPAPVPVQPPQPGPPGPVQPPGPPTLQ